MREILLAGALLASAGTAFSQGPEAPEVPLPILVQEDLYILELGIGVTLEVRCLESTGVPAPASPRAGDPLGPCGIADGKSRLLQLLAELQIASDLAEAMKVNLEEEMRRRIDQEVQDNIQERIHGVNRDGEGAR